MSGNNSDNETDKRPKWSPPTAKNLVVGPSPSLTIGGGGKRKSAFLPYRPQTTVLTNLQRGNTETLACADVQLTFHERAGQGELTDEQIDAEPHPNAADRNGFTPLHWACFYGQHRTAASLLATGADVNELATDMASALQLAAGEGHHELVRLLLQHGAAADHMDIVGNTALMYAAAGNHPHTCNELLARNPDLTVTNEDGETAYSLAVARNASLSQAVIEHYMTALLSM